MLQAISRSLPPLVKDLTLSNNVLGPSSPINISFTILENRTPNETYTIQAVNTDGDGNTSPGLADGYTAACSGFNRSTPLISVEDVAGIIFTKEVSA